MLVLDNIAIHHSQELVDICEAAGVILAYLPPYSPDYNPVKIPFVILKGWLKRNGYLINAYGPEPVDFERFLNDAVRAQGDLADYGALFRAAEIYYKRR